MWVTYDYQCEKCGATWDDMVDIRRSDGLDNRPEDPNEKNSQCPKCKHSNSPLFSAPHVGAYSAMSPDFQREVLKKRSEKHSYEEIRKQPEKWGDLGKEMARKDKIQSK